MLFGSLVSNNILNSFLEMYLLYICECSVMHVEVIDDNIQKIVFLSSIPGDLGIRLRLAGLM